MTMETAATSVDQSVIRRRKGALPPEDPPVEVEVVVPADVSPPLWWPREDDGSLRVYAEVSGERAKQCEAMGLDLEDLGFVAKGEWLVPVENARAMTPATENENGK